MTLSESPNEFRIENPPSDCIQSVKFSPSLNHHHLLAASWDSSVQLYDVDSNTLKSKYSHTAPVLDCAFEANNCNHSWSGGFDQQVKVYDFASNTETVLGQHAAPVRCVEAAPEISSMVTGGWDSCVKLWDVRAPSCSGSFPQPDKVYTCAVSGSTLVIGTQGRRVLVWDLRNMNYVQQRRESSLKYQTRCIRTFPNKQGYVLSSIEGRVAVEYFDPSPEIQKKKYAFKCHRSKDPASGVEIIYPVNAISFHETYNTFATGGSDGYVNVWDGFNKKRLCQFHKYPTSISSLAFSPDGSYLAIASSFLFETDDVKEIPPDNIYVRRVTDQETKPK